MIPTAARQDAISKNGGAGRMSRWPWRSARRSILRLPDLAVGGGISAAVRQRTYGRVAF
jgi:hypothetical protein